MSREFVCRHVGVDEKDVKIMVSAVGVSNLDQLVDETIPQNIRLPKALDLPEAMTEREYA
jgi:glycine dehydrogenase